MFVCNDDHCNITSWCLQIEQEEHYRLSKQLDAAMGKDDTYSKGIQHYKVQHCGHVVLLHSFTHCLIR